MLKGFLLIFALIFSSMVGNSQTSSAGNSSLMPSSNPIDSTRFIYATADTGGVVHYYRDKRIDKIFDIQKDINKRKNGIPGFRVQLYRGNAQKLSKDRAFKVEAMVYQKFGAEADVEVLFKTPYWRVQAGNFRLQSDAMKIEALYKKAFPDIADDISVVPSMIAFPDLNDS